MKIYKCTCTSPNICQKT